jgi:prepilin-type N-terminal cleavage/methylation domain-containing protein
MKERKGFTLIEILIVVAIIAILASIVLVGLGPTQQAGRDARRLSDLREVQNGLELYYNSCGFYPGAIVANPCPAFAGAPTAIAGNGATTVYNGMANVLVKSVQLGISTVPNDPTSGKSYLYSVENGSGVAGTKYILQATLENTNNSVFNDYTAPTALTTPSGDAITNGTCTTKPNYCISL